jgi:hypothetical protein
MVKLLGVLLRIITWGSIYDEILSLRKKNMFLHMFSKQHNMIFWPILDCMHDGVSTGS